MSDRARGRANGAAVAVLATALLGGCAGRGTVVLLPSAGDEPAAVTLTQGGSALVLDRPYAAANATHLFGPQPYRSSPDEVEARFGRALAARPARPATFVLYFVEGSEELTIASTQLIDEVLAEIARRPAPELQVVGHTDTVGTDAFNDALGMRRAGAVRDLLVQRGVAAAEIEAISRGKRDLAVPTPDGRAEPRNRRVTIVIR
jgi:outer membrane protein OmpA-like peptidoglycan-associated protein